MNIRSEITRIGSAELMRLLNTHETRSYEVLYKYGTNSDEIYCIMDADHPELDYTRPLSRKDCIRVRKLHYGRTKYEEHLTKNAIKLYILLHYYITNLTHGDITHLDIFDLIAQLDIDLKTFTNSIAALQKNGYISFEKENRHFYNFTITKYKNMFLSAKNGGAGYLYLNNTALERILSCRTIMSLRVLLISLYEAEQNEMQSVSHMARATIRNKTFLDAMPSWTRPCHIQKELSRLINGCFKVLKPSYKETNIQLNDGLCIRKQYNQEFSRTKNEIGTKLDSLNELIEKANAELKNSLTLSHGTILALKSHNINFFSIQDAGIELHPSLLNQGLFPLICLKNEIKSLVQIAMHFSVDLVMESIGSFFTEYLYPGEKVESVPALLTSIIKQRLAFA